MPNGDLVSFPDDYTEYQIHAFIRDRFRAKPGVTATTQNGDDEMDNLMKYMRKNNVNPEFQKTLSQALGAYVKEAIPVTKGVK